MLGHSLSRQSSVVSEKHIGIMNSLPRWMRRPLTAWLERVAMVLTPQWWRTTLLVCAAWFGIALGMFLFENQKSFSRRISAYTMFNVFLPKLLETESGEQKTLEAEKTLEDTLWDLVIYTIGGCPGAIVSIKRRASQAISCLTSLNSSVPTWWKLDWAGGGRSLVARSLPRCFVLCS
jgi:hypothetical protein